MTYEERISDVKAMIHTNFGFIKHYDFEVYIENDEPVIVIQYIKKWHLAKMNQHIKSSEYYNHIKINALKIDDKPLKRKKGRGKH